MKYRTTIKSLTIAAALAVLNAPVFGVPQTQSATPSAMQAQLAETSVIANQDLAKFIQHNLQQGGTTLPSTFPLGISNVNALPGLKIAYGFPVYTIDPQRLIAGENDLSAMATPTHIWRFVIYQNNKAVGLATVDKVAGQWKTVSYGGAGLAQDIDAAMTKYANPDHSNTRFIRVYQAQSDFLELTANNGGGTQFVPLISARQSALAQRFSGANANPAHLAPIASSGFIDALRSAVKANLSQLH